MPAKMDVIKIAANCAAKGGTAGSAIPTASRNASATIVEPTARATACQDVGETANAGNPSITRLPGLGMIGSRGRAGRHKVLASSDRDKQWH
jgi:hypothetical protein